MDASWNIKQENDFAMFGSEGCGLLDLLATVATHTLQSDPELKDVKTRSLQLDNNPFGETNPESKVKSARQSRKVTEIETIGFSQISKMSLNSLVKHFTEVEFDEIRRIYKYRCALMPDHICDETVQSFGSESKAKQQIKTHLQGHIKTLLRSNDYMNFEAEPVTSKRNRLASSVDPIMQSLAESKKIKVESDSTHEKENSEFKTSKTKKRKNTASKMKQEDKVACLSEISTDNQNQHVNTFDNEFHDDPDVVQADPLLKMEVQYEALSTVPRANEQEGSFDRAVPAFIEDHSYALKFNRVAQSEGGQQDLNDSFEGETELSLFDLRRLSRSCCSSESSENENTDMAFLTSPVDEDDELPIVGAEEFVQTSTEPVDFAQNNFVSDIEEDDHANIADQVSAAIKEQALQCIQELQSRGATTDDLTCRICEPEREFTAYTTLLTHLRSHAQIRPFECSKCQAVFTRQHSLNYHMLIHANSTRFTCNDCGRKFRHPSHFKEHRRRHTGESPFTCDQCDQKYKTRNTFKRHLKIQHGKTLTVKKSTKTSIATATTSSVNQSQGNSTAGAKNLVYPKLTKKPAASKVVVEKAHEDFITDYHYGDSNSNDDEVARLIEKRQRGNARPSLDISDEWAIPDLPKFAAKPPIDMKGQKVASCIKMPIPRSKSGATQAQAAITTTAVAGSTTLPAKMIVFKAPNERVVVRKQVFILPAAHHGPVTIHKLPTNGGSLTASQTLPTFYRLDASTPSTTSKLEQCLRFGSAAVAKQLDRPLVSVVRATISK